MKTYLLTLKSLLLCHKCLFSVPVEYRSIFPAEKISHVRGDININCENCCQLRAKFFLIKDED